MSTLDIKNSRPDISPYLFHFIKGTDCHAKKILNDILATNCLKSNLPYICFTEMPLTSSIDMFRYMGQYPHQMYAPYGIAFPRDLLFDKQNARPVIYSTKAEIDTFPSELKWRTLELTPGVYDYSWLREWRIPNSCFNFHLNINDLIVIVRNDDELENIVVKEDRVTNEEYSNYSDEFKEIFPNPVFYYREYKGISLETICRENINSDSLLSKIIKEQRNGECL